jgi:hypothetical protein
MWIEHKDACNRMTCCSYRHQFCFVFLSGGATKLSTRELEQLDDEDPEDPPDQLFQAYRG